MGRNSGKTLKSYLLKPGILKNSICSLRQASYINILNLLKISNNDVYNERKKLEEKYDTILKQINNDESINNNIKDSIDSTESERIIMHEVHIVDIFKALGKELGIHFTENSLNNDMYYNTMNTAIPFTNFKDLLNKNKITDNAILFIISILIIENNNSPISILGTPIFKNTFLMEINKNQIIQSKLNEEKYTNINTDILINTYSYLKKHILNNSHKNKSHQKTYKESDPLNEWKDIRRIFSDEIFLYCLIEKVYGVEKYTKKINKLLYELNDKNITAREYKDNLKKLKDDFKANYKKILSYFSETLPTRNKNESESDIFNGSIYINRSSIKIENFFAEDFNNVPNIEYTFKCMITCADSESDLAIFINTIVNIFSLSKNVQFIFIKLFYSKYSNKKAKFMDIIPDDNYEQILNKSKLSLQLLEILAFFISTIAKLNLSYEEWTFITALFDSQFTNKKWFDLFTKFIIDYLENRYDDIYTDLKKS